jgi:hypothetical protein
VRLLVLVVPLVLVGCDGLTALGDGPTACVGAACDPADTEDGGPGGGASEDPADTEDPSANGDPSDTEDTTDPTDTEEDPGAGRADPEDCNNGRDDDRNGSTDCADPACSSFCDVDGDGFDAAPLGGDDCDDGNALLNPDADEICDGLDNDCDRQVDGADASLLGAPLWYADRDRDGYGDPNTWVEGCDPGANPGVRAAGDCDDNRADANPGEPEVGCDGVDNDCNGVTQDNPDGDGDGYRVCDECDDRNAAIRPGAAETCDGVDSDCDGEDCVVFSDGFETARIDPPWWRIGGADWFVTDNQHHRGNWAAQSGGVRANGISTLGMDITTPTGGTLVFWLRTSSEPNYDHLHFVIDGVEMGRWSGTVAWTEVSYPLSAGTHELKWRYEKDINTDVGQDAVWIDDVEILGRP